MLSLWAFFQLQQSISAGKQIFQQSELITGPWKYQWKDSQSVRVIWIYHLIFRSVKLKEGYFIPKDSFAHIFPMKFSLDQGRRREKTETWRCNQLWRSPVLSFLSWNQTAHLAKLSLKGDSSVRQQELNHAFSVLRSKCYVNTKDVFMHGLGAGLHKFSRYGIA